MSSFMENTMLIMGEYRVYYGIFIRILMGSGICELESWEETQILIGHQLGHKYWVGADPWQGG